VALDVGHDAAKVQRIGGDGVGGPFLGYGDGEEDGRRLRLGIGRMAW
jgi:hypothetical protein